MQSILQTGTNGRCYFVLSTSPDILPDTPSGVSGGSKLTKITDGAVAFDGSGDYLTLQMALTLTYQQTILHSNFGFITLVMETSIPDMIIQILIEKFHIMR